MADTVRYLMEEMIPELEELESKGYFTRAEVKAVAQKRQDFEYALKRRAALKRDFLRYIDYECKLEELRRHRKKARGIKGRKGLAETGIVRRVHFIFERATRKFKADLSLWMDWLAFCKRSKSQKQFSKVVTKALHRHSHVAALWIEAAAWEFEHSANVAAARALMQQGLRHCPKDESLWAEYLRLELLYVARLRARREVLGLPNPDKAEDFQPAPTPVKRKRKHPSSATATEEAAGDDEATVAANGEECEPGADAEAAVRKVLTGAVAHAVIKGALAAAPTSLPLRARLLRVLGAFDFPGVQQLTNYIYDRTASDFTDESSAAAEDPGLQSVREDAWDLLARRHWPGSHSTTASSPHLPPRSTTSPSDASQGSEQEAADWQVDLAAHKSCCGVYQQAVAALRTCRMHALFQRYLGQRTRALLGPAAAGNTAAIQRLGTVGAELLAAYAAALEAKLADERMCAEWVDWALALNQPKLAIKAAKAACAACPHGVDVWLRRVRLDVELHKRGLRSEQQLGETLQEAVGAVSSTADAAPLWQEALAAAPPQHAEHAGLRRVLLHQLAGQARGALHGGLGAVVGQLVKDVHAAQGLAAFRELVSKLLLLPSAGGDWFHAALDVELAELQQLRAASGAKGSSSQAVKAAEAAVVRLFEAAADSYGSADVRLWLRYAGYESSKSKGPGSVYWRATKALNEPQEFVDQYREQIGLQ